MSGEDGDVFTVDTKRATHFVNYVKDRPSRWVTVKGRHILVPA